MLKKPKYRKHLTTDMENISAEGCCDFEKRIKPNVYLAYIENKIEELKKSGARNISITCDNDGDHFIFERLETDEEAERRYRQSKVKKRSIRRNC